ncbi:MAG: ATP-binding cassette domain-containing protein [Proteobacteria bacterium]|nr:ATP-binding cassette domain-containing protein [Pseudomonadota bacterium]
MDEMIRAENICLAEITTATSFSVRPGDMTILVTPKDEVSALLTRILIGLTQPACGKIFLFNNDIATLAAWELRDIRRRIGIAFGTGGLVSNLKVWENLTLPLYFHQHLNNDDIEKRGLALLERLGYSGKFMDLPGHLTASQRKLIGRARAMLTDPDLILYESPVSGLSQEEKNTFFRVACEFHREKSARASLFITSNLDVVRSLPTAVVINLTKGQIL